MKIEPLVVTTDDACELLTISKAHLMKLIAECKLAAYKEGTNWRITVASIKNYIEQNAGAVL